MNTYRFSHTVAPCLTHSGKLSARHRFNSEDQTSSKPEADLKKSENGEDDLFPDDAPFRGRSRSAPPALWAAKKYGQQLRRMSDEFDTLLLDPKVRLKKKIKAKKLILKCKAFLKFKL